MIAITGFLSRSIHDERSYICQIFKQYEEAYNQRQRESLDAAIDIALAKQGIDPERVPKRDFDQIRRLNIKLNDINVMAHAHIAKIQQEAGLEYNATILELNQISQNLKIAQGVVPALVSSQ